MKTLKAPSSKKCPSMSHLFGATGWWLSARKMVAHVEQSTSSNSTRNAFVSLTIASPLSTLPDVSHNVHGNLDGYHSVELDEESSKLTTFITPWGRYRYLRFPQGHHSAGDTFNGRVQKILEHIPRLVRIVDDMCTYDNSIEEAFWHIWELLTTCAHNGIVLNTSKFQFCCQTVKFAGLSITPSGVQPSSRLLTAICHP